MKIGSLLEYMPFHSLFFSRAEIEYYNKISLRTFLLQLVNAIYLLSSAYGIWVGLGIACNTTSPIVVVLSESMYPGFSRGDILFLQNWEREETAGDICVFQLKEKEIPIVHRIIDKFYTQFRENGQKYIMTKGDNNRENDDFLYKKVGKSYLERKDIKNFVFGTIPWIGMVTIWSNAFPSLKFLIILILFIDMLFTKDETVGIIENIQENKRKDKKKQE